MRALIQRVKRCSVSIDGSLHGAIEAGILILLGLKKGDTPDDARFLAEKSTQLRIFDDPDGTMNLSVQDIHGSVMVVSQFTLYGDTRKGNRPSYTDAASPPEAEELYKQFVREVRKLLGEDRVKMGVFRAMMEVELVNDGPVTVMVESKNHG